MPDVGTPLPHTTYSRSHTSSDQWQSFEIKMRYRRAERCLLRAQAALEAGLDAEARTALDEARSLNPSTPDLETLQARIAERRAVVAAASRRALATRASVVAVAVLLAGALAMIAFWPDRSVVIPSTATTAPPVPHTASSVEAESAPRAQAHPPVEAPAAKPEAVAAADLQPAADSKPASTMGATLAPTRSLSDPVARGLDPDAEPTATSTPPATAATSTPPLPVVDTVEPPLKIPPVTVPQPTTGDAVAARELPAPATVDRLSSGLPTTAAPAPSAPAAPEPQRVEVLEEPRIRAVLARFEAAYSSLSASAAQAVWPTVDARALASAFKNLESQQVSLGRCSVSISGSVAHASCNGTSSWTPKVGAGQRSAARRWTFNLASRNGTWQIVDAEAR